MSSKPSIIGPSNVNHGAVDIEEQKGDRGQERATGEDESRDTKTFLKKGYRERARGSKRIISMHCEKASNMHLSQTLHYAQNLIAQKLLVF